MDDMKSPEITDENPTSSNEEIGSTETESAPSSATTKTSDATSVSVKSASDDSSSMSSPRTGSNAVEPAKPKKMMWLGLIIAIVALVIAGYFMMKARKTTTTATKTVVKNEVALIRYGTQEGPVNGLYPKGWGSNISVDVSRQIFEGLVKIENSNHIVPSLATKWTNPDNSSWVFDLRPGVKFHTGRVMTADDVKASLDFAIASTDLSLYNSTIASITVTGPLQVKVTTKKPDPLLLNRLTNLMIIDTKSGKTSDAINGTGPYQAKTGAVIDEKHISLVAFDDYYGGRPLTREVDYIGYDTEEAEVADLKANKIDIGNDLSVDSLTALNSVGFSTLKIPATLVWGLGFQTTKPNSLTANIKVRQAITLAIDVDQFIKVTKLSATPASQIVPPIIPGYNPDVKRSPRDLVKAKQLLTDAGFPNGITLTMLSAAGSQDARSDEAIRQLAEAGITITRTKLATHSLRDLYAAVRTNAYDMWMFGYSSDFLDLSDVAGVLFVKSTSITQGYDNAKVNSLLAQSDVTMDPAARLQILQQVSKTVMEDYAWAPVYSPFSSFAVRNNLVMQNQTTSGDLGTYFNQVYQK